jgi:hypothetical protein
MDIDLGSDIVFQVKYNGQTYNVKEPVIGQLDKLKGNSENDIVPVLDLLDDLGLPKSISVKMPMSKVKKLLDTMLGQLTEKK